MNISLYQISQDLLQALDSAFDPETGELLPAFEEQRALFNGKAGQVAAYILSVEAEAEKAKVAVQRIKKLADAASKRAEALRRYLTENMGATGVREIKADDGSFKATLYPARDEAVEVFDPEQLPQDYLREIPAKYEPDKALIKKALKDGFDVPGARIVAKDRLTIR